jgi:beta-phosphoglucomutase-like phosphatase (HAD superfamily)
MLIVSCVGEARRPALGLGFFDRAFWNLQTVRCTLAHLRSHRLNSTDSNPRTYQSAIHHLDLLPEECAMVAAHIYDLRAAAQQGMRTIYVRRPNEDCDLSGVDQGAGVTSKAEGGDVDLVVDSFIELAAIMEKSCSL